MKTPDTSKKAGHYRVATVRDVAERAGVAPGTVSNVLTGRRPVAEGLRQLVLKAVEALDYHPNHVAASLRLQQTRSIGIVVPDLTNPFFSAFVRHVEELAAESNYQILLVGSNESKSREADRVRTLIARRIDGLIIAPTQDDVGETMGDAGGLPPTVLVDRAIDTEEFDVIGADNFDAGYCGARHLLKLGHRDIALAVTAAGLANIRERIEGYRHAMTEAGLADRVQLIHGGLTIDSCRESVLHQLMGERRPSAIFATAYVATLGAIQAIRGTSLVFPEDISLLGFDDFEWMTALRPYISTLRQPIHEIAANAWNLLHARLVGEVNGHLRVRLPCTLEVRESTCPPSTVRSGQ